MDRLLLSTAEQIMEVKEDGSSVMYRLHAIDQYGEFSTVGKDVAEQELGDNRCMLLSSCIDSVAAFQVVINCVGCRGRKASLCGPKGFASAC